MSEIEGARELTLPKLNSVDTSYVLDEWLFEEGSFVPLDAAYAVVETSKAAQELVAEQAGFLHRTVPVHAECPVGARIGLVFAAEADRARFLARAAAVGGVDGAAAGTRTGTGTGTGTDTGFSVTAAARALAEERGVTDAQLRSLGRRVIRSEDVRSLIESSNPDTAVPRTAGAGSGGGLGLPHGQRAVAAAVTRSHHEIPAAHHVTRLELDGVIERLNTWSEALGRTVGLAELLVVRIAGLHERFPLFFANLAEDGTVLAADAPRVGVTVDVGDGLTVPVLAGADLESPIAAARALGELRIKALRGRLRESDLAGGNIALALDDDEGLVLAQSIILPPNTCILTLCATQRDVRIDADGRVVPGRFAHLCLAFDHRVINGRLAAEFLGALKAAVERDETVAR